MLIQARFTVLFDVLNSPLSELAAWQRRQVTGIYFRNLFFKKSNMRGR